MAQFTPTHAGMFNTLQERLIARCIRKDLPLSSILENLKVQRDVARKLLDYPEFFGRGVFKKSVMT